ncbi:MAG TPA: archaeosine biosynthesis radical SAM protein RaSEA [Candidatus Methanomethylophilaceae archaeon]|nr:archaeosine biosynthesis radical SAM protein RaSEA [Candidatus Methanomethylophilaceae archaeon]
MRERSPLDPEAVWKEKDLSSGKAAETMVAIMRTSGCRWFKTGGCTMCGYNNASMQQIAEAELMVQLDKIMGRYDGEPFVKIYTSGSFLDTEEIPVPVRERVFDEFSECERILFESRPEFITKEVLETIPKNVTIALGLESSNPQVLSRSVRKGFTPEDSKRAGKMIKDAGLSVRTYLLLKPLYLTESQAIEDTVASAMFADEYSDEISINPINVQRRTQVESLWKRGEFRPPWLWSLIEVFKRLHGKVDARLMSSPSGGGSNRGVHNCGECDRGILDAIERYSLSQNPKDLEVKCKCNDNWKDYLMAEKMLGTSADIERGIINDLVIGK